MMCCTVYETDVRFFSLQLLIERLSVSESESGYRLPLTDVEKVFISIKIEPVEQKIEKLVLLK